MDLLQIVLRVVHIAAAIFWVGTGFFFFFFFQPAIAELGSQGGPVMANLNEKRKLPIFIGISAMLTILAGIGLYWRDSDGFDLDWITSDVGLGFTVGSVAGILAFVLGFLVIRPMVERLGPLAAAMASGQPSQQQVEEMGALQRKLKTIGILTMVLLTIAVIAMATARFL